VVAESEDPDIVRDFLAAREISQAAEATTVEREDIEAALEDLAEIHDYLIRTARRSSPLTAPEFQGGLGCLNWPCGQNPGRKPAISRRA
jgi:hypothetical protein